MHPTTDTSESVLIFFPWKHDRITVSGRRFTGPAKGRHLTAEFDRPSEPVSFSLLGEWRCSYKSGPRLTDLASIAGELTGPGFYGLAGSRLIGFQ